MCVAATREHTEAPKLNLSSNVDLSKSKVSISRLLQWHTWRRAQLLQDVVFYAAWAVVFVG